jgi:hypothetical protein
LVEHHIETGDAKPLKQPPRRVPMAYAEDEKKLIDTMQRQGLPFFFITKTKGLDHGELDFCMIPCLCIVSINFFSSSAYAIGTLRPL